MNKKTIASIILFAVPTSLLVFFFALPVFSIMITYSFYTLDEYDRIVPAFTLENYMGFFKPLYYKILANTFYFAVITTIICLIIAYPVAYTIGFKIQRLKTFFIFLVILPFWTSFLARTFSWIAILKGKGVLEWFFTTLGLPYTSILYTEAAVILGFVHVFLPLMILPILSSMRNLDKTLIDAARDLGAGTLSVIRHIILPLTYPGVIVGVILVFISTFGSFVTPLLLGGADDIMIGNVVERNFSTVFDWPFGSAVGTIMLLIIMAILFLSRKYLSIRVTII